jgi:hypothetical protein
MKIRAKYGVGNCKECKKPINSGEWVEWDKNTRDSTHLKCAKEKKK